MRKQDLVNRMVVELRDGDRFMIVGDIMVGEINFNYLSVYNDDLTHLDVSEYDIVRVYSPIKVYEELKYTDRLDLIWERKWIPEYGEKYYIPHPIYHEEGSRCGMMYWTEDEFDRWCLDNNWVFKAREEAIEVANEMLEVIKDV